MTYTDIGGGGDLKPHGEDYFNRIVNVHWREKPPVGGGDIIFVMGDTGASACYVGGGKIDGSTGQIVPADTVPLGTLDFGPLSSAVIYCSSCHVFRSDISGVPDQSVFLLGGEKYTGVVDNNPAIIMASTDGKNWSTVYTLTPETADNVNGPFAWVFAIVWDDAAKAFYAGAHQWERVVYDNPFPVGIQIDIVEHDILLRSSDGMAWSQIGEQIFKTVDHDVNQGDPSWGETGGLLAPHCSGPLKCENGSNSPDGIFHYSYDSVSKREIFIRPDIGPYANYNYGDVSINAPGASDVLIDITEGGNKVVSKVSSPGIPIYGVAYSGGAIIAVGGTTIVTPGGQGSTEFSVSYDLGDTWVPGSYFGRPPALTVSGKF